MARNPVEHGKREQMISGPSVILLALGANLPSSAGSPAETLRAALRIMHARSNIAIRAFSHFWTSPAYPEGSGPDYCNAACAVETRLDPAGLLAELHEIEAVFGRERVGVRWQARPLDLDLIAWDDLVFPSFSVQDHWRALPPDEQAIAAPEHLILPHPRMQDRGFVLAPLAEIAPQWRHPRTGLSVAQMLAAVHTGKLHIMQSDAQSLDRPAKS